MMNARFDTSVLQGAANGPSSQKIEPWLTEDGFCPSELWIAKHADFGFDAEAVELERLYRSTLDQIQRIIHECKIAHEILDDTKPAISEFKDQVNNWSRATHDDLVRFMTEWTKKN